MKRLKKFLENLYVDDSINGANSIEEAYHFHKKSEDCLLKGGFEFRKFHSNNPSLQQKINQIENAVEPIQSENLKVLRIEWDKFKDTFIIDLHKIFTNGFNGNQRQYFKVNRKYLRSPWNYFANSSFIQDLFSKVNNHEK